MTDPATPAPDTLATLHYGDGEFVILKPGASVRCAISGRPVPLVALRYWSTDRQEAYAGAAEAAEALAPPQSAS